jgi:hypothetical protein
MLETITFTITFINILATIILIHALVQFCISVFKGKVFNISVTHKWVLGVSLALVLTIYQLF